jgi:hypothetical protein
MRRREFIMLIASDAEIVKALPPNLQLKIKH